MVKRMVLIVGASGFLGSYLIRELINRGENHIIAASRSGTAFIRDERVQPLVFDATQPAQIEALAKRVSEFGRITVYYLAAMHQPDAVEKDPLRAQQVNVDALASFMSGIENIAGLYYTSSDTVYGEGSEKSRFRESDALCPINEYGRSKARAEQCVSANHFTSLRLPLLIGPSLVPGRSNFYDVVVRTLREGGSMVMFTDFIRSALDYATAARLMVSVDLCGKDVPGVLNISGDKALSKYDIGLMIAEKIGVDTNRIIPGESAGQNVFEARRARAIVLDNSRLKSLLDIPEIQLQF